MPIQIECLFHSMKQPIIDSICFSKNTSPFKEVSRVVLEIVIAILVIAAGLNYLYFYFQRIHLKKKDLEKQKIKTIIIGAGSAGRLVINELINTNSLFSPYFIVDDNLKKLNRKILGIPIIGTVKDIPKIISKYQIGAIIVAIPSASKIEMDEILAVCKKTDVKLITVPSFKEIIQGNYLIKKVVDINLVELLRREQITIDPETISPLLANETILVTGAGGSIGSELSRQIARAKPKQVLLLGHGENSIFTIHNELTNSFPQIKFTCLIADIQDKSRIESIFTQYHPTIVFHAAAHKHVPLMEENPVEAIKNNIFGTKNVAQSAAKHSVKKFILVSTDKAVKPTSLMGATKNIAEQIIYHLNQASSTHFSVVRFGNVLGSRGSVVNSFIQQIEKGGPITVTAPEMKRYFMTIPEAVQLVLQAGAISLGGEIFVLNMGEQIRILDIANDLIRLSGYVPGKDILVEFCGIRPGEKMFEELYSEEEKLHSTQNDKISFSKNPIVNQDILELIENMETNIGLLNQMDKNDVKKYLIKLAPSYTPFEGM